MPKQKLFETYGIPRIHEWLKIIVVNIGYQNSLNGILLLHRVHFFLFYFFFRRTNKTHFKHTFGSLGNVKCENYNLNSAMCQNVWFTFHVSKIFLPAISRYIFFIHMHIFRIKIPFFKIKNR